MQRERLQGRPEADQKQKRAHLEEGARSVTLAVAGPARPYWILIGFVVGL